MVDGPHGITNHHALQHMEVVRGLDNVFAYCRATGLTAVVL